VFTGAAPVCLGLARLCGTGPTVLSERGGAGQAGGVAFRGIMGRIGMFGAWGPRALQSAEARLIGGQSSGTNLWRRGGARCGPRLANETALWGRARGRDRGLLCPRAWNLLFGAGRGAMLKALSLSGGRGSRFRDSAKGVRPVHAVMPGGLLRCGSGTETLPWHMSAVANRSQYCAIGVAGDEGRGKMVDATASMFDRASQRGCIVARSS